MRIDFVEIANFRKLLSTRVGFAATKTMFVGANNSGKTSAMVALRSFLVARDRHSFSLTDFTLSHWATIDAMGKSWETAIEQKQPLPTPIWDGVLPFIDLWLNVQDNEVHYVQKILPTLDWEVGLLGLRLRLQPKDAIALQQEYLASREDARIISLSEASREGVAKSALSQDSTGPIITLWPQTLTDFLKRRLNRLFEIKSYVLDPAKLREPANGRAQPQTLAADIDPVDGDPLRGLIRIHEISAQRGFSEGDGLSEDGDAGEIPGTAKTRKLTDQLRRYYKRHLDPYDKPDAQDVEALRAIEIAQKAFDKRLIEGFDAALKEMETLGYPGIANPKLNISTRLHPMEGLNHEAAVQYQIPFITGGQAINMHLPEGSNGLGYQNLISMVFRLMSFRDAWTIKHNLQKTREELAGDPRLNEPVRVEPIQPKASDDSPASLGRRQIEADRRHGFTVDVVGDAARCSQISKDLVGLMGEVGEFADLLKKVDLVITRPGYNGPSLVDAEPKLRTELADIQIYLLRLAYLVGADLGQVVLDKMKLNHERYAYLTKH